MTKSAGPALRQLHREFGDRVAFVTLYVREAHPGEDYPQPDTMEEKVAHARAYRQRDGIGWPVAVDDPDGGLHRQLDPKPHAAYLMGVDGTVEWRVLWANVDALLREAVGSAARGETPSRQERQPRLRPMLAGAGHMWEVWEAAGGYSSSDVLREAPPMFLTGRIAALLRPLPATARGAIAMALSLAAPVLALLGVRRVLGRVRRG